MDGKLPEGKAVGHCDRVKIHGAHILSVLQMAQT